MSLANSDNASDERTQQNVRKALNTSLNKFTRVIDISCQYIA